MFVALRVGAGRAPGAVEAMRVLGLEGLSVTYPHKEAVAAAVDELSAVATRLGAVNTVVRRGERLVGESTDGAGFLDAVRAEFGFDPAGRRCLVRGPGGAGRAVILALAGAGAREVVVVPGRSVEKAAAAVALAGGVGRVGAASEVAGADLVVNATPVGMAGEGPSAVFDPSALGAGQVVVDLVYPTTALVEAARAAGARACDGVPMLVHQAAHAFRLWTGVEAPLAAMESAARDAAGAHRG